MATLQTQAGIYQIVNTKNGNVYIGSSNDLNRRKSQHFYCLKNGTHTNPKLQAAYNKMPSVFKFFVIEYCDESELKNIEQQYVNVLWDNGNHCYNVCKEIGRESPPKKTFNVNLIDKYGTEYFLADGLCEFARKHGLHKQHLSLLISGKLKTYKGWRLKNGKSIRPQSLKKTWNIISPSGEIYNNITNLTEFAELYNLNPSSFNKMANGKRNSLFGWKVVG
jgi:group I intron endonuclease